MPTNANDIIAKLSPARRKKIEARAAQLIAEEMTRRARKPRVTQGRGNVFADLGLANAEQEQVKARLMLQIYRTIKDRKLTQAQAGEILGIERLQVASLMRGRSEDLSVERLRGLLTALCAR